MTIALLIVGYLLGAVLTGYVAALIDDHCDPDPVIVAWLAVLWPIVWPFCAPTVAAHLGMYLARRRSA